MLDVCVFIKAEKEPGVFPPHVQVNTAGVKTAALGTSSCFPCA